MTTSHVMRFTAIAFTLLSSVLLVGCGPKHPFETASTSGTVAYNGVPLKEGIIRFVPLEGTPGQKTSVNIVNGDFAVDAANGPAVGEHRIEIESTDLAGLEMDDENAIGRLKATRTRRIDAILVPPEYNSRSQLRRTILSGRDNPFDFELKSRRSRR
jgi:hypothetical protein